MITASHPGRDGLVSVVDLLTKGKTYRRDIDHLVLLVPMEDNQSNRGEDVKLWKEVTEKKRSRSPPF